MKDDFENYAQTMLEQLAREYIAAAKPYIDMLAERAKYTAPDTLCMLPRAMSMDEYKRRLTESTDA